MDSKKKIGEDNVAYLDALAKAQKYNNLSNEYILGRIDFTTENNQKLSRLCDKLGMIIIAEEGVKYLAIIASSNNGGYVKLPKRDLDETINVLIQIRDMMKEQGDQTGM